jgi:hypothetical protein
MNCGRTPISGADTARLRQGRASARPTNCAPAYEDVHPASVRRACRSSAARKAS